MQKYLAAFKNKKMKQTKKIFEQYDSIPAGTWDVFGYKKNDSQQLSYSNIYGYTPEELANFKKFEQEKSKNNAKTSLHSSGSLEFRIVEYITEFLCVVRHRNKLYDLKVSLDALKLQYKKTDWEDYILEKEPTKAAKSFLPPLPLLYAMFESLYDNRNGQYSEMVGKLHQALKDHFKYFGLMTGTSILYKMYHEDRVVHKYESQTTNEIEVNMHSNDISHWLADCDEGKIKALLGTPDAKKATDVITWLTDKQPYIALMDVKSKKSNMLNLERIVVFGGRSDNGIPIDGYTTNKMASAIFAKKAK